MGKKSSTLLVVAKVFMIIGTIALGISILPLAWCIPLTVKFNNKLKQGLPISVGFKIACLLFVNMVAGILMLCDTSSSSVKKAPQDPAPKTEAK